MSPLSAFRLAEAADSVCDKLTINARAVRSRSETFSKVRAFVELLFNIARQRTLQNMCLVLVPYLQVQGLGFSLEFSLGFSLVFSAED